MDPFFPNANPVHITAVMSGVVARMVRVAAMQVASAAMLAGAIIGALVTISDSNGSAASATPLEAPILTAAICAVAFVQYRAMVAVLTTAPYGPLPEQNADSPISHLRYADWLVTMPLLAVKMLILAADGPENVDQDSFIGLSSMRPLIAAIAFAMILCGYASYLSVLGPEQCRFDGAKQNLLRSLLYLTSLGALVLIYYILYSTVEQTASTRATFVYVFSGTWLLYPVVFLIPCCLRSLESSRVVEDVAYSILDILSKALPAFFLLLR